MPVLVMQNERGFFRIVVKVTSIMSRSLGINLVPLDCYNPETKVCVKLPATASSCCCCCYIWFLI